MTDLTLERVSKGHYALADVGTLRNLSRYGAEIEAQEMSCILRRTGMGFGQSIRAVDTSSGTRVAYYRAGGLLGLRGINRGTIEHAEREFAWGSNKLFGRQFTLTEGGVSLAQFTAGTEPKPVVVSVDDLTRVDPLVLLFSCHLAKQLVEVSKLAPLSGAGSGG